MLYKNKELVKECFYNKNGSLITNQNSEGNIILPTPTVELQNIQVVGMVGLAQISWTSLSELSLDYYVLDRMIPNGIYEPITAFSGGIVYYTYDDIASSGTYIYRVRAIFVDGSEMTFEGVTVTIF
mgnify:FL=1